MMDSRIKSKIEYLVYMNKIVKFLLLLTLHFLFIACAMNKKPAETGELAVEGLPTNFLIPDGWGGGSGNLDSVATDWYLNFEQPKLNEYITHALDTANPSIVIRLARMQNAIAGITLAKSGKQVFVNYNAAYNGAGSFNSDYSNTGSVAMPISWEADLWGRIKAGMYAANENMLSEVHNYDYTRQTIAANISRLYFSIASIQRSLEIGKRFREINQRLIQVQEDREKVGIIDSKDVHLAKANVANIEEMITVYKNLLQINVRNLEALMGDYPSNELDVEWEPKELNEFVAISDPYSLIRRRPDLLSIENQVRAAFYLSEQAELAKYPSLVLSANPGLSTSGDFSFGLGASLFGPILNGRAIRSKIDQANAYQRQLVASYGAAIVEAFKEVEIYLESERLLQEKVNYSKAVAAELKGAYEVAVEQYIVGQQDLYYTLQLQADYLLADLNVIDVMRDVYIQRIDLYLALGGSITAE